MKKLCGHGKFIPSKKNQKFPNNLMVGLMELAWDMCKGTVDRVGACYSVLSMVKESSDPIDRKIMLSVYQIFQMLPMEQMMYPINESEFITKYLLPIFQPLFGDDERSTTMRWTATQTVESQMCAASGNRPDCMISVVQGNRPVASLGFGEVKSPLETGNHFGVNKDLLRLGSFCKDAVDEGNLDGSLAIRCAGFLVIFYLVELQAMGFI
ncbi:hypothetical protein DM01DRAFT_10205 [Hesseltinella vesiculosa]|uniref:Uncharacterized protein n=1 Tax=Hesseltinella vesiculosa TaxID=101127 RepID=A0A1X2GCV2_9FUNG|nr:hypothetical protein DM01DRAFT_10205 [Hesseltinella vesiculosa]